MRPSFLARDARSAQQIKIVRVKDRIETPAAGWRDVMLNFYCARDPHKHVCELQIVHEMMLTARKGLPGHEIYNIVRNASELMESSGQERELRLEAVRKPRP